MKRWERASGSNGAEMPTHASLLMNGLSLCKDSFLHFSSDRDSLLSKLNASHMPDIFIWIMWNTAFLCSFQNSQLEETILKKTELRSFTEERDMGTA